jgi:prefoldin subunit 5
LFRRILLASDGEAWLAHGNMLEERIQKTESAVNTAENISADQKSELLGLLAKLKSALGKVEHREDAESIARFAEASVHEATRKKKKRNVLEAALHGLKQSVEEFEASHPELAALVSEISTVLANMGL